jgi:hypothetical protein
MFMVKDCYSQNTTVVMIHSSTREFFASLISAGAIYHLSIEEIASQMNVLFAGRHIYDHNLNHGR